MNTPRNLYLLPIDDALRRFRTDPGLLSEIPENIDIPSDASGWIDGSDTAKQLWAIRDARIPDLVTSDVLFELDETSELAASPAFDKLSRPIPDGMFYACLYAFQALQMQRPMGIGLHSKNAAIWKEMYDAIPQHPMGILASFLVDKLYAINGSPSEYDGAWEWLGKSRDDLGKAIPVALADYRRRLLEIATDGSHDVFVRPAAWAEIASIRDEWRLRGEIRLADDVGIRLTYADGTEDYIKLASIFADVNNVSTKVFPVSLLNENEDDEEEFWTLTDDGHPRLGAFLAAFENTSDLFDSASALLRQFPAYLDESSDRLRVKMLAVAQSSGELDSDLVGALAIFFQAVRAEHYRYQQWINLLGQDGWNPKTLVVDPKLRDARSLREVLVALATLIRRKGGEEFLIEEIVEGTNWPDPSCSFSGDGTERWIEWHFQVLAKAGMIEFLNADRGYACVDLNPKLLEDPPIPLVYPGTSIKIPTFLEQTLGYSQKYGPGNKDDSNAIPRMLASVFLGKGSGPTEGRKFRDRVLNGEGRVWIVELCRDYAYRELKWRKIKNWPKWFAMR